MCHVEYWFGSESTVVFLVYCVLEVLALKLILLKVLCVGEVASNSEVADYMRLNTPPLILPFRACGRNCCGL